MGGPTSEEKATQKRETNRRAEEFLTLLRDRMGVLGHEWKESEGSRSTLGYGGNTVIDGVHIPFDLKEMWSDTRPTGRLHITIGGYPHKTRGFPEPKAGFDVNKIANVLSEFVTKQAAENKAYTDLRAATDASWKIAREVNAKLGITEGEEIWMGVDGPTGALVVRAVIPVTPTQAAMLIRTIKNALQ